MSDFNIKAIVETKTLHLGLFGFQSLDVDLDKIELNAVSFGKDRM